LHFDVLLPAGKGDLAGRYAREWLQRLGIGAQHIDQESCLYCHSDTADAEVKRQIEANGYFIYPMEGCPASATPQQ
jgi:Domain of unknown function (DUF2024)